VATFKVGDRVLLVDHPNWVRERQYIGRVTTIVAVAQATDYLYNTYRVWAGHYVLDMPGAVSLNGTTVTNVFAVLEPLMRKLDDGDDFAEPRDMSDDTPNKITTWDACPFKPKRETV
jgi:hypothetical protein